MRLVICALLLMLTACATHHRAPAQVEPAPSMVGAACEDASECRTRFCAPVGPQGKGLCQPTGRFCSPSGRPCHGDRDCCSLRCGAAGQCVPDGRIECLGAGLYYRHPSECCGGLVDGPVCARSGAECAPVGFRCGSDRECCSNRCAADGKCQGNY